jgi:hypothetical protein
LERLPARAVAVGRARQRLDERAGVADDGEFALVKERLHLGHARVEPERAPLARRADGQQARLREREPGGGAAAARAVVAEARGVERDDHVVAVVAAVEEDADERAVVGRALRVGVQQPEALEGRGERGAAEGAAGRA